ncbi:MAG: hypothetical protein HGA41_03105 [Syntrophaceae bacterium]|nr:hypothetical protein [Syntrophaceae bacterium]
MGWIGDNCFIFLLLPFDYRDTQQQTEFDWSKYGPSDTGMTDSALYRDEQLSLLDELESQIARRKSG